MPFIGIISKENDFNYIKKNILRTKDNLELLNININNIENYKNIKFDIIVIHENIQKMISNSNYIINIINNSKYKIINLDENIINDELGNSDIITYGFNSNSMITLSSIEDEIIMICIQNNFIGNNNIPIEEQEIKMFVKKYNTKKLYNIIVILIILKIYGKNLKKI